ncbi:General stress protein 16O [Variovorax sp. PBL-H6]|uniref:TraR/DksA C4-type zinc finger protein n=1 Tax=Variovorax sp. PBL-H6 TaxID=434009 RepID=UPI001319B085|nr:TraR/DksA C4-type zinc finger protein [Variovorax sp. PBL-H6]VTU30885.1 General stress protein 16O [Variovorax sp. PBL-H6]
MNHLSVTDCDAFAERLELMKRSVLEELYRAIVMDESARESWDHEVRSHADEAEALRLEDLRGVEVEIDRARLEDIRQAQRRMAEGRYGVCSDCAENIPRERLLAQPAAIRCAACQAALEAPHRR